MKVLCQLTICLFFILSLTSGFCQSIPASEENIPYLVTFGNNSATEWGDDDYSQTFFFVIPQTWKKPFFIRVYDPDTGGNIDEINGVADTKTSYTVFGGQGTFSHPDASSAQPIGNYNSGTVLGSRVFDSGQKYDETWFSFGPFNPVEGEFVSEFKGYVFKIIAEGISGDDGNLYKYFVSTSPSENSLVEGANAFTFEYSFRLWDSRGSVSHIYPFINQKVVSIKIHTFDFDHDGIVRIVSRAKKSEKVEISGDNMWASSTHEIEADEKNSSLDIQMIKTSNSINNNVVFYITNQYGELLPFFTSPIGGVPKYNYQIKHKAYEGTN